MVSADPSSPTQVDHPTAPDDPTVAVSDGPVDDEHEPSQAVAAPLESDDDRHRPERDPWLQPARRPGRRVTRIVRRVQLWSVFKVALFGSLVFYAIFLLSVATGWSLANSTGQVHHIEKFMRDIGFDNWSFDGPVLFKGSVLLGAVVTVAASVLITLAAAIVNLISELTGGIRLVVLEVDESEDDELLLSEPPDHRRTGSSARRSKDAGTEGSTASIADRTSTDA